jgi:hypothetical protein
MLLVVGWKPSRFDVTMTILASPIFLGHWNLNSNYNNNWCRQETTILTKTRFSTLMCTNNETWIWTNVWRICRMKTSKKAPCLSSPSLQPFGSSTALPAQCGIRYMKDSTSRRTNFHRPSNCSQTRWIIIINRIAWILLAIATAHNHFRSRLCNLTVTLIE